MNPLYKLAWATLRKISVFLVLFVFILSISYIAQAEDISKEILVKKIAVLPLSDKKDSDLGSKIQKYCIDILSQNYSLFTLVSEAEISEKLKSLGIKKDATITPEILTKFKEEFSADMLIFGSIIKMKDLKKASIKIKVGQNLNDFSNINLDIKSSDLQVDIQENLKTQLMSAINMLPYSGYVTNIQGDTIELKIDKNKKLDQTKPARIIRIVEIKKHPVLNTISEIVKEEIAAVTIEWAGETNALCKILKVKDGEQINLDMLTDQEESTLAAEAAAAAAIVPPPTESSITETEGQPPAENIDQTGSEAKEFKEQQHGEPTQEAPTFEPSAEEPQLFEDEAKEPTLEDLFFRIGILSSIELDHYKLLSGTTDLTSGGLDLQTMVGFGANTELWFIKYMGFEGFYQKAFMNYDLNITLPDGTLSPSAVQILTDRFAFALKGRIPLFRSKIAPRFIFKMGFEYFQKSVDAVYYDDTANNIHDLLFLTSNKFYSPFIVPELDFPLGIPQLGLRAFFKYWFLHNYSEDPALATGTDPYATTLSFGTGIYWNIVKLIYVSFDYERYYHKTDYLGSGSRFRQTTTNALEKETVDRFTLGLSFRIF